MPNNFIIKLIKMFGWKTAIEIGNSNGIGPITMCLAGVETVLCINPIISTNYIRAWRFADQIRHIKLTFGEARLGLDNVAPMQLAYLNDDFTLLGVQIEQVMSKCEYVLLYNSHQYSEMRQLKNSLILNGAAYIDAIAPDRINSNIGNFDDLYDYDTDKAFISITLIRSR
jgi:hypothetical protein